jgi:hypothetical protein
VAYSSPSTRTAGDIVTAAIWNQDVVANVEFLAQPPSVRVSRDATLALASGTWEEVAFDTENWDTNTMWSSTAATKVFCKTTGKFLVCVSGAHQNSTVGGSRGIGIRKNSTTGNPTEGASVYEHDMLNGTVGARTMSVTQLVALTTGQYVQLVMFQDTGSSLNASTSEPYQPRLSMIWMSS